ncbi:MAG: tetratricopeptide repeat protein, partial [Alphaproteobacteria bacterium]|nr:tetratricopeptide repeat protein [Alphaproteobacteria bacterium]
WLDKASALDTNDPDTFILRSTLVDIRGDTDTAIALIKIAMRLDPHYPASNLSQLGAVYLRGGDAATAIEFLERAQKRNSGDWLPLVYLTVAYAETGRLEDAKRAANALVERRRELGFLVTLAGSFEIWWGIEGAYGERIHQALLKAGLPEMPRPGDLNLFAETSHFRGGIAGGLEIRLSPQRAVWEWRVDAGYVPGRHRRTLFERSSNLHDNIQDRG